MLPLIVASCLALGSTAVAQRTSRPAPYAIVGVGGSGPSPTVWPRRNINDLENEAGPQWDLYVQALAAMKAMGTSDPLSYFQVAGIHGLPAIDWNNTGPGISDGGWPGYCPHSEALFLPWHRPYVLLHEQSLVANARRIAATYTGSARRRYTQAAERLRVPYWDWADPNSSDVPPSTVPSTLRINTPQGPRNINNPLAGYSYPKAALDGQFGQFSPSPRRSIVRCRGQGESYPDSANDELGQDGLREQVYDAFLYSNTFEEFSTTSSGGSSLEQAHNAVHGSADCGENFAFLTYSAFDPLFMLHHCNVDRLFALWQAANPDKDMLSQSYRGKGRFTTPPGTLINNTSPLAPFYDAKGQPHTPMSVRSTIPFGYTYDNLDDPSAGSNSNMKREAREHRAPGAYGAQTSESPRPSQRPQRSREPQYSQDDGRYETQSSAAYGTKSSAAYETQSSAAYGAQTSDSYELQTSDAVSSAATQSSYPQPSHSPHGSREVRRKRATAMIKKLYSGKAREKKQTVYLAHMGYKAEDIERPARISVYLCNKFVGRVSVLAEPSHGQVYATLPLNRTIKACERAGVKGDAIREKMGVQIVTNRGKEIPLADVKSMRMKLEDLLETPSGSETEFPRISNRHTNPVNLKQHKSEKPHHQPKPLRVGSYAEHEEVQQLSSHRHGHSELKDGAFTYQQQEQTAADGYDVAEASGTIIGHPYEHQQSGGYGYYEDRQSSGRVYGPSGRVYSTHRSSKHTYGSPPHVEHEHPVYSEQEPSGEAHEAQQSSGYRSGGGETSERSRGRQISGHSHGENTQAAEVHHSRKPAGQAQAEGHSSAY